MIWSLLQRPWLYFLRRRRTCSVATALVLVTTFILCLYLISLPCDGRSQPEPQCVRYATIGGPLAPARNFTIVTAYLNIGAVIKGQVDSVRDPQKYGSWMWPYAYILNGVVAYFDDARFANAFATIRGRLPTKIVMVNRSELWAFSMINETARIFAQPDYPHNYPKSTNPEFVAVMHAKTELTDRAVRENPFRSTYFAWMDMGVYRELPRNATDEFMLSAPKCLCDNAVFFGRIHLRSPFRRTVGSVMREGWDWVAGGLFIARADAMLAYCADYQRHVEKFLRAGLANHDQSIIYAMYLPGVCPRPVVPLQAINTKRENGDDQFFFTALQLRRLALSSQRATTFERPHLLPLVQPCSYEFYW